MTTSSRSPTRRDVARLAGVSDAVVSYVMNDGPRPVAPATRDRVLAAVRELGYRPNAVARALKLARSHTIGLIVRDNANRFFAEFAKVLEDGAFERGYAVLLGNSSGDPARERAYVETFLDRSVDALVIIGLSDAPPLQVAREHGTPLAVLDHVDETDGLAVIAVDNEDGARTAVRHLLDHGHPRIGCIAGPPTIAAAQRRVTGWRDALEQADRPAPEALVARSAFTLDGGRRAVLDLMGRARPPTALFVSSDIQAIGALHGLDELGFDVPRDVALVSFDGTLESAYTRPPLTVVEQPLGLMARTALDMLLSDHPEGTVLVTAGLVVRRSCGCPGPM